MKVVTIHEAKTNLSKLIQEVINGEEVVIADGNKGEPLVRLVASPKSSKRKIGLHEGQITLTDDFDEELEDFEPYMPKKRRK